MRKKLSSAVLMLFLAFGGLFFSPQPARAANAECDMSYTNSVSFTGLGSTYEHGAISSLSVSLDTTPLTPGNYNMQIWDDGWLGGNKLGQSSLITVSGGTVNFSITSDTGNTAFEFDEDIGAEERYVYLYNQDTNQNCYLGAYFIKKATIRCGGIQVSQIRGGNTCYAGSNGCVEADQLQVKIAGFKYSDGTSASGARINVNADNNPKYYTVDGSGEINFTFNASSRGGDTIGFQVVNSMVDTNVSGPCTNKLQVGISSAACPANACLDTAPVSSTGAVSEVSSFALCEQIDQTTNKTAYDECIKCAGGEGTDGNPAGIYTAVGCIPREPGKIATAIIKVGLGIGGGFGLVSTLVAGFLYSISAGDVKKTDQAKEMLTNSLIGLVFIIFSVTILQFIGYNILRIPGFGG